MPSLVKIIVAVIRVEIYVYINIIQKIMKRAGFDGGGRAGSGKMMRSNVLECFPKQNAYLYIIIKEHIVSPDYIIYIYVCLVMLYHVLMELNIHMCCGRKHFSTASCKWLNFLVEELGPYI